jgi:phosphatidylglycerophosphate synthase
MTRRVRRFVALGAFVVGVILFVVALQRSDLSALRRAPQQLGVALLLVLLPSAAWHLLRTVAWWRAFPPQARIPFIQAFRVRLAAEAFSYMTVSGLAGDPLKVVMLDGRVPATIAASAVALERVAYVFVTAVILAVAAVAAAATVPLDHAWARAFVGISIVALSMAAVMPLMVLRRRARSTPTSAIGRFLHQLATDARALVANPRRLGALCVLEAAAYLMMVLEVWAILRASGTSIPWGNVVAIETFTRAASFASAVIPANLGALEVSNVAAAAAVHAAGAAAMLAVVRRLRGLAWCAAGFVMYPRPAVDPPRVDRPLVVLDAGPHVLLLSARLGGWSAPERVVRAALRAGYTRVLVWTALDRQRNWRTSSERCDAGAAIVATHDLSEWQQQLRTCRREGEERITVLAPGTVPSPPLLEAALASGSDADGEQTIAEVPAGTGYPHSGIFRVPLDLTATPERLIDCVDAADHEPTPPAQALLSGRARLSLRVSTPQEATKAEHRLRASIIKSTDGRLARFNRRLSIPLSVVLIRYARLSPHVMSVLLTVIGVYAGWLFSRSEYVAGVVAALLSWVASVLDGCDGELARLQYKESAFGCWLDTAGDYVYYVAIFAGITMSALDDTRWPGLIWIGGALGLGMLLTFAFLILLRWRITDGRPELLRTRARGHFYSTGSRWTRLAAKLDTCTTRSTMPYGILMFALLDALPALVVLAAFAAQLYWISLATQTGAMLRRTGTALDPVRG